MRPTTVTVQNAEHADLAGRAFDFWVFEDIAQRVACGHRTGGYIKAWITVTFDDHSSYQCRLDLGSGYKQDNGFQSAIEGRLNYYDTAEAKRRRAEWPEEMRTNWEQSHALWLQMDFSHPADDWVTWEVENLRDRSDTSFCTLYTSADPYEVEDTLIGAQYLIPGTREY